MNKHKQIEAMLWRECRWQIMSLRSHEVSLYIRHDLDERLTSEIMDEIYQEVEQLLLAELIGEQV